MGVLSIDEINNHFVENRYMLNVIHHPEMWQSLSISNLPNPVKIKFDGDIKNNMDSSIKTKKGLYMFFLEPNHPFKPAINHLLYVGRVRAGDTNFNFFKRFDEYKSQIGNINGSLNKVLLTNLWPDYTYVYFYPLDEEDEEISRIEDEIIKKIVPPLNSKIGGKTEQTRNLY